MRWITRERPKIDRVACPWLITRFIDPQAEFLFASPAEVSARATELNAIPYDVEGVELSHDGPLCSFDAFLQKYRLTDPVLQRGPPAHCCDGENRNKPRLHRHLHTMPPISVS